MGGVRERRMPLGVMCRLGALPCPARPRELQSRSPLPSPPLPSPPLPRPPAPGPSAVDNYTVACRSAPCPEPCPPCFGAASIAAPAFFTTPCIWRETAAGTPAGGGLVSGLGCWAMLPCLSRRRSACSWAAPASCPDPAPPCSGAWQCQLGWTALPGLKAAPPLPTTGPGRACPAPQRASACPSGEGVAGGALLQLGGVGWPAVAAQAGLLAPRRCRSRPPLLGPRFATNWLALQPGGEVHIFLLGGPGEPACS